MIYTREMVIRMLADKCKFYQRDVRTLLSAYDDLILELMNEVTDDEEVSIQVVRGAKLGCKIVKPRERVNPATQEKVICPSTVKPFVKWSETFRENIQNQYDDKNGNND